ncbi:MAG: VOC family protein [Deltaproteobacteria bacterium]|nr:VOC family protein [Deltaproteobacteria bacterium]MBW2399634.1 VOC family protein [Deltaproteobacteria bacterium]
MRVESLDHIHIYCEDPEASAAFYTHHFEAAEVLRNSNSQGALRIFLGLGGQVLVLGPFPAGHVPAAAPEPGDGAYHHGFGVAHIGLRVADVATAVAELSAAGVAILSTPVTESTGLTFAYVAAPDGVVLELTQYPPPTRVVP